MTPTHAVPMLGLDAQNMELAFPFHLVVDEQLRVVQAGASLRRLLPQLQAGVSLQHYFTLLSHKGELDFKQLCDGIDQLIILYHAPLQLKLRGQFCLQGKLGILLLSLWLDSPDHLGRLHLCINDFALHDPVIDLLNVVQAHRVSLDDSKSLSRLLEQKRRILAESNAVLREREGELERISRELHAIVELSSDGLASFDGSGQLGYANSAFYQLLGVDAQSACKDRPDSETGFDRWVLPLLAEGGGYVAVADMPDASSDLLVLRLPRPTTLRRSVRHLTDEAGQPNGRILYLRDISREREIDAIKTEFLTTAAHELRTPLTSIFGYAELLLTRDFDVERSRSLLGIICRHSRQLIQLLNELLDLVRMESRGRQDFQFHRQPLQPLVDSIVHDFVPPESGRALEITADADAWANIDTAKFRTALGNVLSNALKYSPDGSPLSLYWQRRSSRDGSQIGLAIADRGMGMTSEQLSRACERFFRAEPNGTIPGTGLGLPLVLEIMKAMDGDVSISSQWQQGTTVTLWLPLVEPLL